MGDNGFKAPQIKVEGRAKKVTSNGCSYIRNSKQNRCLLQTYILKPTQDIQRKRDGSLPQNKSYKIQN